MATYWLPSSSSYYSTSNSYVRYRIRIVENSFNASTNKLNITVQAYFYRTNSGYTTDYAHKLKYTVNGTSKTYTNAYGDYPITSSGKYMNAYTVDVPVNSDGSVSISVYCQYTPTNSSSGLSTSNNGGTISLTKQSVTTYTISYNANGGSGAPSSQTKYHGTALTLSSTIPTRSGYTFLGWGTSSTATSATYGAGSSYTANASATLYAVWASSKLIQTIMARYQQPNGTYGDYTTVYSTALNSGATCSWSFTETDEYNAVSVSYTVSATTTKYVDITRKQYNISYNANGGLWTPPTQTFYYGCDLRLTKKRPTRSGYRFLGWSLNSSDAGGSFKSGGSYDSTDISNPTLYAIWTKENQDVFLYRNGQCQAQEYAETSFVGFGRNGEVNSLSFTEGSVSGGSFAIGENFIATELREGFITKSRLVDENWNYLVDESGNYLIYEEEA